jgi:predicted small lipoprotein YifL
VISRRRLATLLLIASLLAASACGQMGPLTLPEDAPADEDDQDDGENER